MNLLIILLLSVGCLNLATARVNTRPSNFIDKLIHPISKIKFPLPFSKVEPLSFRESTVSTPAFDARRKLRDNLINELPLIQQEVLFSLLTDRWIEIGKYESKLRLRNERGRRLLDSMPIDKSELYLRGKVATKKGYRQLLSERHILSSRSEERSVFGVNHLWKVNLSAVMPQTAALTHEDFIASFEFRTPFETVTWSVMNLVATGHEDVVNALTNSTLEYSSSILQGAVRRYHLKDGTENLAQQFSYDLETKKKLLEDFYQARTKRKAGNSHTHGNTAEEETEEIARREKEITEMEQLVGNGDAVAEFYVSESLQQYNKKVERIALDAELDPKGNGFFINSRAHNRVISAEIADLGVYGWFAFNEITSLSVYYDNFFDLLAQEVEASRASP